MREGEGREREGGGAQRSRLWGVRVRAAPPTPLSRGSILHPVRASKALCLPPCPCSLFITLRPQPLAQVAAQQLPTSMGGAGPAASTKKNVRQAQDLPIYSVGEWGDLSSRRPCSNIHTKA